MVRSHINRMLAKLERPYEVYNRIEVSKSALLHNVRFFADTTALQIIPVLKGNAYGHGIEQVAIALKDRQFPYIAVDGYFEALKVRQFNKNPVLVMGMIKPVNIPKLRLQGLAFLVQDKDTIKAFGKLRKPVKLHLDINTGMNRYGIRPDELSSYLKLIKSFPKLELEGVMSHLADSDGDSEETVTDAVEKFDDCVDKILTEGFKPKHIHIAQSAGSQRTDSRHTTAIRLGLSLYGINPFPPKHPLHKKLKSLKPALQLISTITKIQQLQPGDKVSYNYTYEAPKKMEIGILPLGYHEGIPRELSNRGSVTHGKHQLPIIGRVCMNHTLISLDNTSAKAGDEVTVISNNSKHPNSIENIAAKHDLFTYSLLTTLSPDIRRYLTT